MFFSKSLSIVSKSNENTLKWVIFQRRDRCLFFRNDWNIHAFVFASCWMFQKFQISFKSSFSILTFLKCWANFSNVYSWNRVSESAHEFVIFSKSLKSFKNLIELIRNNEFLSHLIEFAFEFLIFVIAIAKLLILIRWRVNFHKIVSFI